MYIEGWFTMGVVCIEGGLHWGWCTMGVVYFGDLALTELSAKCGELALQLALPSLLLSFFIDHCARAARALRT